MPSPKSKSAHAPADLPPPAPAERELIGHAANQLKARREPFVAAFGKVAEKPTMQSPHSDSGGWSLRLLAAFGTASSDFAILTVNQLAAALRERDEQFPPDSTLNGAFAFIDGVAPQNEVEACFAVQMAATHGLAMNLLRRTRQTEYADQMAQNGALAVKLLKAFTIQAETLAKLRRGGNQTVRVEHVHVHAGGQAVVGNIAAGGGAQPKIEDQPHAKQVSALNYANAPFDPLRSTHTKR